MTNLLLTGSMYMLSGELWLDFFPHPVSAYEPEMTCVPVGQTATITPLLMHEDAPSTRITSLWAVDFQIPDWHCHLSRRTEVFPLQADSFC